MEPVAELDRLPRELRVLQLSTARKIVQYYHHGGADT